MNFASLDFFAFLAIVYSLYRLLPHRWQNWLLLGASYYFYGSWDWRFLFLIGLSTTLDFYLAKAIHATDNLEARKSLLTQQFQIPTYRRIFCLNEERIHWVSAA